MIVYYTCPRFFGWHSGSHHCRSGRLRVRMPLPRGGRLKASWFEPEPRARHGNFGRYNQRQFYDFVRRTVLAP